jgi:PAS domain S-box-containing protein
VRYRRLFEAARDGILILNADTGQIEDANPFIQELLGYTHHQLIGKELWEIGLFEDIDKSRAAFRRLQKDGVIRYDNLPLTATNGVAHEVEFVSNVYDEEGRCVVQCNIRDITERKSLERQLTETTARIAEASRLKSDFIGVLSHELRNPLAAIRYALPRIEDAPLDARARSAAGVIARQLALLSALVGDLLDLTRISSGKIAVTRVPLTVQAVVKTAVESVSPALQAARHVLEIVTPGEPVYVEGDGIRLAQVFSNLLMNAVKYTPREGRITISVGREGDEAIVRIIDNGMGIPPDQLKQVFQMFMQVHPNPNEQGGLGVGLTIAKRIVELHDGSIEAHSGGSGYGTEMVVRLPIALPAAAAPSEGEPPRATAGRQLKVLIVDDNADLVEMLEMCVGGMGHQVRKALDGQTAIAAALSYHPDVVLLDLGLPIVSGIDVARQIRRHADMSHTRLIAMTGWGQEEDRRLTAEAGFDHHLTKPTHPDQLEGLLTTIANERAQPSC